jgi:hypothetical protein
VGPREDRRTAQRDVRSAGKFVAHIVWTAGVELSRLSRVLCDGMGPGAVGQTVGADTAVRSADRLFATL